MFLPWLPDGENIDLAPEGFMLERGCSLVKGDVNEITTPTGRVITIRWWGMLPCLTKSEWQQILDDLPPPETPGRSGWPADTPRVARACMLLSTPSQTKEQLRHLRDDMNKHKFANLCAKSKVLPEKYYDSDNEKFVTPAKIKSFCATHTGCVLPKMWEWFSGSWQCR